MKPTDRDTRLDHADSSDRTEDALDRLLAEIRVPVAAGFSRQVMSRIDAARAPRAASRRREWWVAAAVGLGLAVLAAVLVAGGRASEPGIGASILDLLVATLAAGAGLLAASWRGLGQTVDAALDGSAVALVALGVAALAANGLLLLLLRRRRVAARPPDER